MRPKCGEAGCTWIEPEKTIQIRKLAFLQPNDRSGAVVSIVAMRNDQVQPTFAVVV